MTARQPSCVNHVRRLFRVSDPLGLHMRPAALLARTAGQFEAEVIVQRGDTVACGKSLLQLLKLCVRPGDLLGVVTEGVDAVESMNRLEDVFRRHEFMINA